MKIGIMSDSHHDLSAIDDAICLADDVDCWLHAGDSKHRIEQAIQSRRHR